MSGSIWRILGVPADSDAATIRRAYAQKLKVTQPEDDPEGFQALRAAYEEAMGLSRRRGAGAAMSVQEERVEAEVAPRDAADAGPDTDLLEREEPEEEPSAVSEPDPILAAHQRACRRLFDLVLEGPDYNPPRDLVALRAAALRDLLDGPAMGDLRIHADTEQWLLHLILQHAPRADVLIAPACAAFGWKEREARRDADPELAYLLHRLGDYTLLTELQTPGHKFHGAYKAFFKPPRSSGLQTFGTYWAADRVRLMLRRMVERRESMLDQFDPELVDLWQAFLKRFWFPFRQAVLVVGGGGGLLALVVGVMAYVGAFDTPYEQLIRRTQINPGNANAWVELCRYRARHAVDLAEAVAGCDRAVRSDPDSLAALANRAQAHLLLGHLGDATADYQRVLARSPNDPMANYGLGLTLERAGAAKAGAVLMRRGMVFAPKVAEIHGEAGLKPGAPLAPAPEGEKIEPREPEGWVSDRRSPTDKKPDWAAKPSANILETYYPPNAAKQRISGKAKISCRIRITGKAEDCFIVSEAPFDAGFGEAALKVAKTFKMRPGSYRGEPVDDAVVTIPMSFRPT